MTNTMAPLVSIITPSLNQGEFLEECILSITAQSYKNIEHIVVDGISTDNTLDLLKKYKHIRWISEKDNGYWDALTKGVRMAKGKYILICMASDGYLNKKWIEECVKILERDREVSMVWGFPRWLEEGKLTDICYPHFVHAAVPQKFDWLPYWLQTGEALPNGNFCVYKHIFEKCNTVTKNTPKGEELYILNYNFNTLGYLPFNIPVVAEYCREHPGQIGRSWTEKGWLPRAREKYFKKIDQYKRDILLKRKVHIYKDSSGKKIKTFNSFKKLNSFNGSLLRAKILFYILRQRGPRKITRGVKGFFNN